MKLKQKTAEIRRVQEWRKQQRAKPVDRLEGFRESGSRGLSVEDIRIRKENDQIIP